MPGNLPPADFAAAGLRLHAVPPGSRFGRIYAAVFADPLGYGKRPSRFSDPRRRVSERRYGVLYLGETIAVCFLETVLRDRKDGIPDTFLLPEEELATRVFAEVEAVSPLNLVDLRGNNAVTMGVPTDVTKGVRQGLGRAWSLAFHEHPAAIDGVIYPSRLNGQANLAIYGRAIAKLTPVRLRRLTDVAELAPVLADLQVALAP